MAVGEVRRQAVSHAAAKIVETLERRRTAPGHKECDWAFAAAKLAARERRRDCCCDRGGFYLVAISGNAGAITGTLRSGSISIGETKSCCLTLAACIARRRSRSRECAPPAAPVADRCRAARAARQRAPSRDRHRILPLRRKCIGSCRRRSGRSGRSAIPRPRRS